MALEVAGSAVLVAARMAARIFHPVSPHQMRFEGQLCLEQQPAKFAGDVFGGSILAVFVVVENQLLLLVEDFAADGALQVLEPESFVGFLQVVLQVVDSDDAAPAELAAEQPLVRMLVSLSDVSRQSEFAFANFSADFALQVRVLKVLVNLE